MLLAFADRTLVWRIWAALAPQSAEARTAKQRKFAQRQALIDEQLRQAEAKSATDGSHSLYKVIKTFKRGRPSERIQLRDEQGRFLTATEERKALDDYSCEPIRERRGLPTTWSFGRIRHHLLGGRGAASLHQVRKGSP